MWRMLLDSQRARLASEIEGCAGHATGWSGAVPRADGTAYTHVASAAATP